MVVGFSCAMISLLTQNTICCSTHTAALHVNYNSLTLRYCFVFNFDHIKTFCIVQKQLHKRSEYQFAAKKVLEKSKSYHRWDSNWGAQLERF